MNSVNYRKIKAIEKLNEKKLLELNPNLDDKSGIYFLTRTDTETRIRYSYVGQALHIKSRMLQHMKGYQHIDLSLRKHGLYSDSNKGGWDVNFIHFPKDQLDEKERYYITLYAKKGYQSRNKDTGGGKGKKELGERKPSKGYYDGLKQGKKSLANELYTIIEKHLEISLKQAKTGNKISQKQLEKFWELLNEENYN